MNDIESLKDPEGAEFRRRQHERHRRIVERERRRERMITYLLKALAWLLGTAATAAVYFLTEWLLKKHMG